MIELVLIGTALALAAGAAAKLVTDRTGTANRITRAEFVVGALVCALVVVPASSALGVKIAKSSAVSYNEFWSGFEATADVRKTPCRRDGSCVHAYDCDPYQVTETYTENVPYTATETYTTSDGKTSTRSVTRYRSETRTRQVTKYHRCPYVNAEYTFTVSDTLGQTHTIGDHWFPADPERNRWDRGGFDLGFSFGSRRLPSVPSGTPEQWARAKARIDAGTPGGTTKRAKYDNYVLASQRTILRKHNAAVDRYRKAGLLPDPARKVHHHYLADKAYFVGKLPADPQAWQEAVMRFNGALGTLRQGDLHLIVVQSPKVTDPDEYAAAVQARWQAPALGKDALSKNGVVVIVGSRGGETVAWSRAFTGMPVGNNGLVAALLGNDTTVQTPTGLAGTPLTPRALLGQPTAKVRDGKADVRTGDSALERALLGQPGYVRVSMSGDGSPGYKYLLDEIQPTGGQKALIALVGLLLSGLVWAVLIAYARPADRVAARLGRSRARSRRDLFDQRLDHL